MFICDFLRRELYCSKKSTEEFSITREIWYWYECKNSHLILFILETSSYDWANFLSLFLLRANLILYWHTNLFFCNSKSHYFWWYSNNFMYAKHYEQILKCCIMFIIEIIRIGIFDIFIIWSSMFADLKLFLASNDRIFYTSKASKYATHQRLHVFQF